MKRKIIWSAYIAWAFFSMQPSVSTSQDLRPVVLPEPQIDRGRPLMRVLKKRSSVREYSNKKLPLRELSNVLWAAFGVIHAESGKRTAPSAFNSREIEIYVTTVDGCYLYNADDHRLQPVVSEDLREFTGSQSFVKDAPVNLVYVADFSKMRSMSEDRKIFFSAADTGFISQNVYLYCASEGLATVVRGGIDTKRLAQKMKLRHDQRIIFAQTVGYPKKK